MNLSTYIAGALLLAVLVGVFSSHPASPWAMACAVLGSLLPHWLDHPTLQRRFGYRTITHSIAGLALVALFVSPLLFTRHWPLITALLLGYASHLLLDAATVKGVLLFYPSLARAVLPRHQLVRIEPGTPREGLLRRWLVGLWLVLLPLNAIGLRGVLRWLIPAPQFAVEDYLKYATASRRVFVAFTGRFNVSQRGVSGCWEALDAPSSTSLLVEDPEGARYTLGTHPQDSIRAFTLRAHAGPPIAAALKSVHLHEQPLSDLLSLMPTAGQTYITGSARIQERVPIHVPIDQFPTIHGEATQLTFRFATAADLRRQGLTDLLVTDGEVLLRTLTPSQGRPAPPPLLQVEPSSSRVTTLTIQHLTDPQEILVRPRDRVQAGQLLADLRGYRVALLVKQHAAHVQRLAAQVALDALRRKHDQDLVLKQQEDQLVGTHRNLGAQDAQRLAAAEDKVAAAQARCDALARELITTEIHSPLAGRVLSVQVPRTTATILIRHD